MGGNDGWSAATGSPAHCLSYSLALAPLSFGDAYSHALLSHMKLHPRSEKEGSWKSALIRQKSGIAISSHTHTTLAARNMQHLQEHDSLQMMPLFSHSYSHPL